jgi:tetratricopeptide (TPR) repeat protein
MKISEQGVITEEALLAYARNELGAGEKQELEKLLHEDPFAQEALEGLLSAKDKATVPATISSVNRKVRERAGLKEKRTFSIHWTNYAWAAVVFGLLIGIGFIMVNYLGKKTEQPVAMNKPEQPKETPAPVLLKQESDKTDSANLAAGDTTKTSLNPASGTVAGTAVVSPRPTAATGASGKSNSVAQPAVAQNVTATSAAKPPVNAGAGVTANNMQANKTPAPVTNGAAATPAGNPQARVNGEANKEQSAMSRQQNTPAPMQAMAKEKAEKKAEDNEQGNLDEAMKNFNSGDYKKSGEEFDKILKHDPDNIEALYFGGISDYIDNKTGKSEAQFDKVLKKGNKYTEGSKWYKANILLKKGDIEHAKAILQDLTNSNNPYKERAIKKMAEMGF